MAALSKITASPEEIQAVMRDYDNGTISREDAINAIPGCTPNDFNGLLYAYDMRMHPDYVDDLF